MSPNSAVAGVQVSYATKPEYANPGGTVMGGLVAAFLADCMGPLIVAATGAEKFPVTLDLHTTYFKPVPIGPRAAVEVKIDRLTASAAFTSATIHGRKRRPARPRRSVVRADMLSPYSAANLARTASSY